MQLSELVEKLEINVIQGSVDVSVTSLTSDSRKVTDGTAFVCIAGAVSNGHKYIASAVDAGFTFGFCFRLFLMTLLLVCYPKLKKKNLIMLNMAFLFLCSNMAFNSVLVMRDRISILFSMGIVCIMPYLIAVLCHSKAKVFIVGLLFAFMFAQVYVQHNTPAAKYENILLGISDKARAKIRIFEESSKAVDR